MKLYIVTQTFVQDDEPTCAVPEVYLDPKVAINAWRDNIMSDIPDLEAWDPWAKQTLAEIVDKYDDTEHDWVTQPRADLTVGHQIWVKIVPNLGRLVEPKRRDRPYAPGEKEAEDKRRMDELKSRIGLTKHKKEEL